MIAKRIAQAFKTLLIVDVQEDFSTSFGGESFVEKILQLARQYKQVYQVHDTNITEVPTYEFPNQVKAIPKNYGFDLQREDVSMYFNVEDPDQILNIDEGTGVETNDGRYLLRTSGVHEWFLLDEDLFQFLSSLRGKQVDIVGGAQGECLTDVYESALALGVNATILQHYTY